MLLPRPGRQSDRSLDLWRGRRALTGKHLEKRSLSLSGHRTSVALEPDFWGALQRIAAARDMSLQALVAGVDAARAETGVPLTSALRVMALREGRP
ncbi:ribbon-helix-helix domain-containing protein [Humitalea sp. 24SJ18S-53]|uniref:ribbon-helix-helix domain-containing protein n=1 Tax=Humitalea sp. 24SJ18S-53 TaxID=3422307 RepID=UPI003D67E86E